MRRSASTSNWCIAWAPEQTLRARQRPPNSAMHMQLDCPHCAQRAMPAVVKALTSPWQVRECRRCGCRIGVPWWGHGLAMLPILGILILLPLVPIRDGL